MPTVEYDVNLPLPLPDINAVRFAAFDMDGTLLGPDHDMHPENIAALHRLQSHGIIELSLDPGRGWTGSTYRQVRFYILLLSPLLLADPMLPRAGLVRFRGAQRRWGETLGPSGKINVKK